MPNEAIRNLKSQLVVMGEMGENALDTAVMALIDRDDQLAYYVIEYDREIDERELEIDRLCLDLLAGGRLKEEEDWRLVIAFTKINNDIERIGDLAVAICQHVLFLIRERSVLSKIIDFQDLLEQVCQMVRESVEAVVTTDIRLAWKIIDERPIVDDESHLIFREVLDVMKTDPRVIERGSHILGISQCLQRVADQATNIAEEVVFMKEGVSIRHHLREFHPVVSMPFGEAEEAEREETKVLQRRRPREEVRAEMEEMKRTTKVLTREMVAASAAGAVEKVKAAREKLLRRRAAKRKAASD